MYLKVFTHKFGLDCIEARMTKYAEEYAELYKNCMAWAEKYITSSVDYRLAPVLRGADDLYGTLLGKAPFDLAKLYKSDRQNYISFEEQEEGLEQYNILRLEGFKEGIESIRLFYNERTQIYMDSQKIYLLDPSTRELKEG